MNAREAIAEAIRYGGRAAAINKALFVIEGLRARGFTIMSKADVEAVIEDMQIAISSIRGRCEDNHKIAMNHLDRAIRALKSGGRDGKEARE